jgi:hypothetical protein
MLLVAIAVYERTTKLKVFIQLKERRWCASKCEKLALCTQMVEGIKKRGWGEMEGKAMKSKHLGGEHWA